VDSDSAKFGGFNSQFYWFLGLCGSNAELNLSFEGKRLLFKEENL
jgi:hypothetical protein